MSPLNYWCPESLAPRQAILQDCIQQHPGPEPTEPGLSRETAKLPVDTCL